ncbi:ester cyclase [Phytohabitans rumicis]|uniref:Ester cyclase n=1 Tax=Phytohabitans rumicis TaxID=1076125 RepID=A0A6V8LI02_9ACTN|nr:ester cyclase [Phytohabitans rumicis]GFJ95190.1 hypothetical protein Prum_088320 [Phytohabitans rumicis]
MNVNELRKLNTHFFDEVFRRRNVDAIDELLSDDFVEHTPAPGQDTGKQGAKEFIGQALAAFPDMDVEIEHEIAEGDTVATVVRFTGTHQGEFAGVPATGRKVSVYFIDVTRYRDGLCTEHWGLPDIGNLMVQLGAAPGGPR